MRKNFRILLIVLILVMGFMIVPQKSYLEEVDQSITILFTHDMHDHLYPFEIEEDGRN